MINWQHWTVAILLFLCFVWIGRKFYLFFYRIKDKDNPCENCATGCELKQLMDEKRLKCNSSSTETNKKRSK